MHRYAGKRENVQDTAQILFAFAPGHPGLKLGDQIEAVAAEKLADMGGAGRG